MDLSISAEDVPAYLRRHGLRPTSQRVAFVRTFLEITQPSDEGERTNVHVDVEQFHSELKKRGIPISLATAYNTFRQFVEADIMREVVVAQGRSLFEPKTEDHDHIYDESTGLVHDIPSLTHTDLPDLSGWGKFVRVSSVIRVRSGRTRPLELATT